MICTKNKEKSTQKETLVLYELCVNRMLSMGLSDHHSDHEQFHICFKPHTSLHTCLLPHGSSNQCKR